MQSLLRSGRITVYLLILALFFATLNGCARRARTSALFAGTSGYSSEFDEPSARGKLQRVTPESADARRRFAISPDGKHMVYSGAQSKVKVVLDRRGNLRRIGNTALDLWKIKTTGGAPVKITSGGGNDCVSPSFTKDGKYIVYEAGGTIWKVRSDGAGGRTKIPGSGLGYDKSPDVSPADNKLVFSVAQTTSVGRRINTTDTIWTSDLNGGELTQLREGSNPRWSPDGKQIVFDFRGDIWIVSSIGTDLTQLTNTKKITEGIPSFSQDGRRITFTSNEVAEKEQLRNADYNVWSMNLDGTNRIQHTQLKSWDSWPLTTKNGVYFLSGRAAAKKSDAVQRIWLLKN